MLVTGNMCDGAGLKKRRAQRCQGFVLGQFKALAFQTFQFNTDGIVIAVASAPIAGIAGMPGAVLTRHKLPQRARAADKKVRRHLHPPNALEVGMGVPVELVGEKALYVAVCKFPGRPRVGGRRRVGAGRGGCAREGDVVAGGRGGTLAAAGRVGEQPGHRSRCVSSSSIRPRW